MFRLRAKKELTDEEAMVRYQNGNEAAFNLLLDRHSAGVLRFIMKRVGGTKSEAEDLLQDVFLKVIEHRKKYNPNQKFTTWLYSLARNHCIDYLRVEKNRCHTSLDDSFSGEEGNNSPILGIIRSGEKNQEKRLIDNEIQALLDRGIEDLKEEFREVFLLREIEGLSLNEIAEITEAPLSTVKSRLRYAYQDLRGFLIKAGYFEEEEERAKEV